ncbi:MAG: glycosyltransferase, partial [Phycisphaerales bacterium]|nr:glycosyltransferase [Phycisphaerales bacterium]
RICARQRVIDVVMTPSRFLAGLLEQRGLRTVLVRNPIPMERPARSTRPSDALHLVYAGRLAPEKGVREFLRQLPAHLPLRVHIIGDGPDEEACRSCVERRTLIDRVTFHGRLSHDEALARIAAGHVLIMPGRCHENAPLVVFEALAQGTNVLLARRGGLPEIVEDLGVGMLFEPEDPAALTAALTALVQQHEAGTLNDFDVSALLGSHMEWNWSDTMLTIYGRLRHRLETNGTLHPEYV